jgi:uncharacterized protein (TIGR03435 family)
MRNVTIADCVQWAYSVPLHQIAGVKLSSESYDILARSGADVPVGRLKAMLQTLLADRFALVLHRETRQLPVYELVVAKGGPKLPAPRSAGPVHAAESLPRVQDDAFLFQDNSLAEFAGKLSQLNGIDLPVVDRTGIPGSFDILLKSAPRAARDGDSATLFALIQEQLGLRLVAAKAPFDVIVIDRVERPSGN